MGSRKKKIHSSLEHARNQGTHACIRAKQRYHWVTDYGLDKYDTVASEILWTIRNGYAEVMWGRGRMAAYAVRTSRGDVFVGYDPETDTLSTWFPKYDVRIQAWALDHWGALSARNLHRQTRYVRMF